MKENKLFNNKEIKFSISYDADDAQLSEHRIEAHLLSKTIESVAQLIKISDEILRTKDEKSILIFVTSPAKEGSLVIDFMSVLLDPEVAKKILGILGFIRITGAVSNGVFQALRKISGREIIKIHSSTVDKTSKIELSDGEIITVDKELGQIIASPKVRECVKEIITKPLLHRESPSFKILNSNEKIELEFKDSDVKAIRQVKTNYISNKTQTSIVYASFSQVNFEKMSSGWKINYDDKKSISVLLLDKEFFDKIRFNKQSFKREDIFKIELQVETSSSEGSNAQKQKYKILKVLSNDRD